MENKIIEGVSIDLKPVSLEMASQIFNMRNVNRNKYFFNQQMNLTLQDQEKWLQEYSKRENDIYWAIYDKQNVFIGTIRLYDIDYDKGTCEQGSFMIAEEYAKEGPYAIEAELISLDYAFNELNLKKIVNCDRYDNKKMNSLTKKIGFEFVDVVQISGVDFNRYELTYDNYEANRHKLATVIDYWRER